MEKITMQALQSAPDSMQQAYIEKMSKDRTWNSVAYSKTLWASSHSDKDREINDYYATEPKATELLLQLETFNQKVWECACWEWHMSEVLKKHWHNVYSTDLIDRWYWEQLDFLNNDILRDWDIITNPPYKYANQFIEQCLKKLKDWNKFALFLPIRYTEWKERKRYLQLIHQKSYMYRLQG